MAFKQLLIRRNNFILSLIVLVTLLLEHGVCSSFNRSSFPHGFVFGTASSAYQYEGAAREGGRRPSIWDTFTHLHPDKIADGSNGDVAVDFYHRYKEDINNMKKMGMDAFRFSISWPRILPNGSLSGGINKEGINFYNNLINEILSNGMQPFVTIFHWDVPQALEDKYLGFLSLHIIKDYVDYIDICFKEFGDRVKQWITFNEPHSFCTLGYSKGTFAPGRCSSWQEGNCSTGNSATEPYICSHNMLLAHSAAVKLYKDKYQGTQRGKIGITINTPWFFPHTSSKADTIAAKRMLDFFYGWYMDPLTHGDYPVSMRKSVGIRLPKFTKEQSELLKGSYDFLGINYYATYYAVSSPASNSLHQSYETDSQAILTVERNGTKFPQPYNTSWIYIYPPGLQDLMLYTKANYKNPVIYITENGVDQLNDNNSLSLKEALNDTVRISYHRSHLLALRSAIRHGADVRGYFAWSFTDNFEWASGYRNLFGLYFVDYNNNLVRHPKKSAVWFSMFLKK